MEQFPYSSDTTEYYHSNSEHTPANEEETRVDLHVSSLGTAEVGRARADIKAATVESPEVIPRHERIAEVGRWLVELRQREILGQELRSEESASDYTLAA